MKVSLVVPYTALSRRWMSSGLSPMQMLKAKSENNE